MFNFAVMQKILVIQTAFIGDVVLATALLEKLHGQYPNLAIDILVRKGNESLFQGHPFIHKVVIWDKKKHKQLNLIKMAMRVLQQPALSLYYQGLAKPLDLTKIHSVSDLPVK